ncbi:MAG: FAD-binding protein, partial [Deltaproteobacteria bacterium]|nr:FAD-binding protein [Deltaproteobacteria bacterium]
MSTREHHNESLASWTTLGIGGPTPRLLEVTSEAELLEALRETAASHHPALLLGGGSNLVIADEGVQATVLHPSGGVIHGDAEANVVRLRADAGVVFDDL